MVKYLSKRGRVLSLPSSRVKIPENWNILVAHLVKEVAHELRALTAAGLV